VWVSTPHCLLYADLPEWDEDSRPPIAGLLSLEIIIALLGGMISLLFDGMHPLLRSIYLDIWHVFLVPIPIYFLWLPLYRGVQQRRLRKAYYQIINLDSSREFRELRLKHLALLKEANRQAVAPSEVSLLREAWVELVITWRRAIRDSGRVRKFYPPPISELGATEDLRSKLITTRTNRAERNGAEEAARRELDNF